MRLLSQPTGGTRLSRVACGASIVIGVPANDIFFYLSHRCPTSLEMASCGFREVLLPQQSKVGWNWGRARNDVVVPQPLMSFYWNMPQDAPCILSLPKRVRSFKRGAVPHGRRSTAWDDNRVCETIHHLRKRRGPKMNTLIRPKTWEDMFRYFDAIDLWHHGAWNLWRVIHYACDENERGRDAESPSSHAALDTIDDWVYAWCTHKEHRIRLSAWDERSDVLCVLSPTDISDISSCNVAELSILRGALKYWHRFYKNQSPQENNQDIIAVSASSCGGARNSLPVRARDGTYKSKCLRYFNS